MAKAIIIKYRDVNSKVNTARLDNELQRKGLYVGKEERDSCGVGLIADLKAIPTRYVVDSALIALENMEHRGACGFEKNTGDGAGILTQIPYQFFKSELLKSGVKLPKADKYGVGMFFLPQDEEERKYCESVIHDWAKKKDFTIFFEREVPRDNTMVGESAKKNRTTHPSILLQDYRFQQ